MNRLLRALALLWLAPLHLTVSATSPAKSDGYQPLRVAVVAGIGVYQPQPHGNFRASFHSVSGFETELLQRFSTSEQRPLHIIEVPDTAAALAALKRGEADIAAAHFSRTYNPAKDIQWSLPIISSPVTVVHNIRKNIAPGSALDLLAVGDHLNIANDDCYSEIMRQLQQQFPELSWQQRAVNTEAALAAVEAGIATFTLADQHELLIHKIRFPTLAAAFDTGRTRQIVWALRADASTLADRVNRFISQLHFRGKLSEQYQLSFGHLNRLGVDTVSSFRTLTTERLPRYAEWLQQAADKFGYDWRLLAAMSYQESRWNPSAKSPTGVRGFMMLTRKTAYELNVADRTDPRQSIFGGAKFLRSLSVRLGPEVTEPNRSWLALAAYNIGMGHLRDARQLSYEAGDSPNLWMDIKQQLPLLAEKPFCETLRHGCARGQEAADYVTKIRAFYDLLHRLQPNTEGQHRSPGLQQTHGVPAALPSTPTLSDSLLKDVVN